MEIKMKSNQKKYYYIIKLSFYLAMMCALTFLFIKQASGAYLSDLGAHIASALSTESQAYTIIKPIFRGLYYLTNNSVGISMFLALVEVATIECTERFIKKFLIEKSDLFVFFLAIVCNFVIAIPIIFVHRMLNVGLLEGNEWHNSTYMCMKLVGLLIMEVYLKIDENYLNTIKVRDWLCFALLLVVINMIKPNFLLVFAPTLLCVFLYDLVRTKGKGFKQIFILGCAVLCSVAVLLYQYKVLYVSDSSSGIAIGLAVVWRSYHRFVPLALVQSLAFPLYVLIKNFEEIKKDRKYSFSYLMLLIGLAEYILLYETGERMYHGNFDWGLCFAVFYSFVISVIIFYQSKKQKEDKVGKVLLWLHFLAGVLYFGRIMLGGTYY